MESWDYAICKPFLFLMIHPQGLMVPHVLTPGWKKSYIESWREEKESRTLSTPGLDYTRLFISLTAGAGT